MQGLMVNINIIDVEEYVINDEEKVIMCWLW